MTEVPGTTPLEKSSGDKIVEVPTLRPADRSFLRTTDNPSDARSQTRRRRRILASIVITVVLVALVWTVWAWQSPSDPESTKQQPAPPTATIEPEPEPVCRAEGEFVAGFMSPQADDAATAALLDQMQTDAVTFGGRIEPIEADHYPDQVAEAIGDRPAYEYTVTMNWQDIDLPDTDQRLSLIHI